MAYAGGSFGCPDAIPYCCYIDDEELYYPANTVLIDVLGKPAAQFRYYDDKLSFESGEKGTEKWLIDGIPIKRQITVSYKAEKGSDKCQLKFFACSPGDESRWCMKVPNGVDCSQSGFTRFSDDPFTYTLIRDAPQAACPEGVKATCYQGEIRFDKLTPETVLEKPGPITFKIPFAK